MKQRKRMSVDYDKLMYCHIYPLDKRRGGYG